LRRIADGANSPFSSASAYNTERYRSVDQTTVRAEAKTGQYDAAVRTIEQEVRRLNEHGILDTELQREIVDIRTALQAAVASAATRQTTQLADTLIFTVNEDTVFTTPQENLAVFEEATRGFNGQAAHQLARTLFTGSGPLLFATSPEPIPGGHAQLAQAFTQSRATPVQAPVATASKAWPYERMGTAGTVAQREEIADLGATRVRFANGVTLLVKPTQFDKDKVQVSVSVGGGRMALKPDLITLPLTQGAFTAGGLDKLDEEEVREALAGKVVGSSFRHRRRGPVHGRHNPARGSGHAAPAARRLCRPSRLARGRVRAHPHQDPEHLQRDRLLADERRAHTICAAGPVGRRALGLPQPGRARCRAASAAARRHRSAAAHRPHRGRGGRRRHGRRSDQAGRGHRSAPCRSARPSRRGCRGSTASPSPAGATSSGLRHAWTPDVAFGLVAWPTDDFYDDPAEARAVQVLRAMVQIRAIEKLREELGATYSPIVLSEASEAFDEFGMMAVGAEVNPAQLDRLMQIIVEVAEGLKSGEVSADELARAREPMLLALGNERATNGYWVNRLGGSTWDPRRLDTVRTQEQALRAVTPCGNPRLAQKYLIPANAYHLAVDPPAAANAAAK
jgi:zinc protease